jgi:hypothetical protein
MKRSQINRIMREALSFCESHQFVLPPFAFWTPDDWRSKGPECRNIVLQQLGWDITDFGRGDYDNFGLFLFTLRNGCVGELEQPGAKTYAEKLLIVDPGQITPTHFHWHKTEDIINRGGGELVCQLWNSTDDEKLADTEVVVVCDGVERRLAAGETISLGPGESVTLPARMYHKFWGAEDKGRVLVGEVSQVNDDHTDNCFLEPIGRFPQVEEDEPPLHLLCGDYPNFYRYVDGN